MTVGAPVLYLHGLCDLHSALSGPTPFLVALGEGRVVHSPPLPGYPGAPRAEEMHDVEDYVFHLGDFVDALEVDEVDLVGHSFGGWLAAELALRRPDVVRRLVLLSPLGLHVPEVVVPPVFGYLAPRGVGGFGESRGLLFADPDGIPATEALPDAMAEEQQLRWFGGLAAAARLGWKAPQFQSRRLYERLPRIGVQALVLCGEEDVLVPEATRRAWADRMPDAELFEIPEAGHALVLEWPDSATHVSAFLEQP